jgi:hypothetical protein
MLSLVADAPHGHVPRYLRAQLPRMRALVNALAGRHETVDDDFTTAATLLSDFGAPFYLAKVRLERAQWLRSQGRADETAPLLDDAMAGFAALGATPWVTRVEDARAVSV